MTTKEYIEEIFNEIFDEDEYIKIYDDMAAEDVDSWDSLTHIQLIAAVEKKFNIKFTTGEVLQLNNVGEFIELVEKKIK